MRTIKYLAGYVPHSFEPSHPSWLMGSRLVSHLFSPRSGALQRVVDRKQSPTSSRAESLGKKEGTAFVLGPLASAPLGRRHITQLRELARCFAAGSENSSCTASLGPTMLLKRVLVSRTKYVALHGILSTD